MPRKPRLHPWLAERNGVYYAFWYNRVAARTERQSLHTGNPDEAKHRFAAFLLEGKEIYSPERPAGLNVATALDDYTKEHVNDVVVDRDRIAQAVANLKAFFVDTPLASVDIPMCHDYAAKRRAGRIGGLNRAGQIIPGQDGTIRRELNVLTAAANHAVKWRRMNRNDMPYIWKPTAPRGTTRWLTPDELARLRSVAKGRLLDFIEIAYYTASRREAIEQLTWPQVDLDRMRINLSRPNERQTKKRRPIIPIDPALLPTLRRLSETKENFNVLGATTTVYKAFKDAASAAGLGPDVTPHTLRHTRATHLLQAGVSPWAVANLLGDTLTTVIRVYGHHCPDFLADAMRGAKSGS